MAGGEGSRGWASNPTHGSLLVCSARCSQTVRQLEARFAVVSQLSDLFRLSSASCLSFSAASTLLSTLALTRRAAQRVFDVPLRCRNDASL